MIAKAKSISHGINDIRYITGESRNKKHPERIFHVKDNLLPPGLDATGIWDSMRLTLAGRGVSTTTTTSICGRSVRPSVWP